MRIARLFGMVALGLSALVLTAYGVVHVGSERALNRTYDVALSSFSLTANPATASPAGEEMVTDGSARLAEGERLARIRGCIGCHGSALEGKVFFDQPWLARVVAPDLTRIASDYTDAELERVIRRGVRRDGRSTWAMPSPMYYHLSDDDLSDDDLAMMIAYIRSVAPSDGYTTEVRLRLLGRLLVFSGKLPPLVAEIDTLAPRTAPDPTDPQSLGRYLAMTSCTECHGPDLRGPREGDGAPDLRIAAAFSPDDFARLMREGVGLAGRELGLMGGVARGRFVHFTDEEVRAIHAYLATLVTP
jgi:mono/diheme cytochrome c family protein